VTSASLTLTLENETGDSLAVDSDILIGVIPAFAEMSNEEFVAFVTSQVGVPCGGAREEARIPLRNLF
jgi:hypothetical protein